MTERSVENLILSKDVLTPLAVTVSSKYNSKKTFNLF